MLNSFFDGFWKKIGEHVAGALIGSAAIGGVIAWFTAPSVYTFQLKRVQITIAVMIILFLFAATVWITRLLSSSKSSFFPIDDLQKNIIRLLWSSSSACLQFEQLKNILLMHNDANRALLACQRLQKRGFIACNIYDVLTLVQLLEDGREYAAAHHLTDARIIIQRAADSITNDTSIEDRAKLAAIATHINHD